MQNEELKELKREVYKDFEKLRCEYKSFKNRISTIANMFLPGIGFILYNGSYLKGFIVFVIFVLYNILFFNKILNNIDMGFIAVLYYSPAIVIWGVSTIMVSVLDD